jgi:hypothetical protein
MLARAAPSRGRPWSRDVCRPGVLRAPAGVSVLHSETLLLLLQKLAAVQQLVYRRRCGSGQTGLGPAPDPVLRRALQRGARRAVQVPASCGSAASAGPQPQHQVAAARSRGCCWR